MNKVLHNIRRFLYGQHFADGVRMTMLILAPSMIASYFGYFDIGLTMSVGALCVSISDTPGPAYHKHNAMLACCSFIFVISILTGFLRMNVYVMGGSLTLFAFFFAMFTMYGPRAGLLGTSILLLMVLQMDKLLSPIQIVENSLLLTTGGLWYSGVSILILHLVPYRSAQRALGECIRETAAYLSLRSLLYNNAVPLDKVFARLIAQQVILNDKQSEVRDLLFKNKRIISQSETKARAMVLTFDEVIDLYEKISASNIDYALARERYAHSTVLTKISDTLSQMAEILDKTGAAVQYNNPVKANTDIAVQIRMLSNEINAIIKDEEAPLLDSLLTNLQNMYRVVTDLQHYFTHTYPILNSDNKSLEHALFVSHQRLDIKLFRYNLTFDSLTFRHSVRMALACLCGFILAKFVMHGHHSYWLLITIIFVLKPAFSLTKERNTQRILGTLIGGLMGVAVLLFIHNTNVLFVCMFIAMLLTYSFQRHKYLIAVVFMTPYLLILFHFMHVGLMEIAEERVLDTILGSIIAIIAGYLILPDWESAQIKGNMTSILSANYRYLRAVSDRLNGAKVALTTYKLIRKDVYVSASNLSAALQRMKSEPSGTRKNTKEIERFSMLNHILTSRIAATNESTSSVSKKDLLWAERSLAILEDTIKYLNETQQPHPATAASISINTETKGSFQSIYKTISEIEHISQAMVS